MAGDKTKPDLRVGLAHNPKVVGSNPAPATKFFTGQAIASGLFAFSLVAPNLCLNSVRMYSKP